MVCCPPLEIEKKEERRKKEGDRGKKGGKKSEFVQKKLLFHFFFTTTYHSTLTKRASGTKPPLRRTRTEEYWSPCKQPNSWRLPLLPPYFSSSACLCLNRASMACEEEKTEKERSC